MAASKMYMIDMLQLQRDVQGSSIAIALQTSRDDADLLQAFAVGLVFLHANTKPTVSSRVAERLLETIPEEHLPFLQSAWDGLTTGPAEATNVIRLGDRESRSA